MKKLHKNNLYCWTEFNQERNIDFHSYVWVRPEGLVLFDPLPLSDHDREHLLSLGRVTDIFITNSDHLRDAKSLAEKTEAKTWGPVEEKDSFGINCNHWIEDRQEVLPGLKAFALHGSKTPGELAFLLEGDTLITGDLIRAHEGGRLCLLPDAKLRDKAAAIQSVKKLAEIDSIQAVLPGDGWPVFRDGQRALLEMVD